jgi:16S rRNA (guanine966-N2)-methyltransferase
MRVIAGTAKGRTLLGPKRDDIRPTSDRVRETIFNVLGQWIEGRVLDLFAGTGALAIEALSRGASRAVLVDSGREAQQLIEKNLEALGFTDRAELLRMPFQRALDELERRAQPFELVFADPPYAAHVGQKLLEHFAQSKLLAPEATLVLESDKREPEPSAPGIAQIDERKFGDTRVRMYRRTP